MIADKKRKILEEHICENSLLILIGRSEQIRNGDVYYPFRQDSDMILLTGAHVPDIRLVGCKRDGKMIWTIYSDEITEREGVWGTSRVAHADLRAKTGIEDIREMSHFSHDVASLEQTSEKVYIRTLDETTLPSSSCREKYLPLEPLLVGLRLIKLPEEVECIRRAIAVTKLAYEEVRANIIPGMYEYEIEALIAGVYRSYHLTEAYPTIVASGPSACTLHYTRHDRMIEAGDLVLVDFGAEHEGYAADITRVFAVDGRFTPRQLAVYDSVLAVKSYAESLIKPGVKKSDYEKKVRARMNEELVKLELFPTNPQSSFHSNSTLAGELTETESRKYYPHSTSHFLGLDVHDVGSREEILAPGMVLTCEPGIYIPEEGIGIRLEDDILITEDGCENLSKSIPL